MALERRSRLRTILSWLLLPPPSADQIRTYSHKLLVRVYDTVLSLLLLVGSTYLYFLAGLYNDRRATLSILQV